MPAINGPRITTAHSHVFKLQKFFEDWTKGKIDDKFFIAKAAIEIQEALRILNDLISRSME